MRVYIQIKQLGKRKCSIEKIPIDFPVPPVNVQGLIEAIVSWQVCEYNERLQQSEVLKYLTQEEVENKTASGKVGFAVTIMATLPQKSKPSPMLCNPMRTEFSVSSWMIRKPETYPLPSNLKKNLP